MNVGIIILVLIVIFFVFVYKELSTCKSIVSKINEDIETTKSDMKHRIKCEMNDCLDRVQKINYDNMQQLKRINQFNNSPITKKYTYLADAAAAAAVGTACPSFEDYDDMHCDHDIFRRRSTIGESDIFMSGPSNGAERETQNYIYDASRGNGLDEFPNYDPSAGGTLFVKNAILEAEKVSGTNQEKQDLGQDLEQDLGQDLEQDLEQILSQHNKSINSNLHSKSNKSNNALNEDPVVIIPFVVNDGIEKNINSDTNSETKKSNRSGSDRSRSNSSGSNSSGVKSIKIETKSSDGSVKLSLPFTNSINLPSQQPIETNNKQKFVLRPITHYDVKELREMVGRCKLPQTRVINGKRKLLSKAELYASMRKYLKSK